MPAKGLVRALVGVSYVTPPFLSSIAYVVLRILIVLNWLTAAAILVLLLAWLLAAVTSFAAAQGVLPVPELTARVIDQTGTLDAIQQKGLEDKLMAFEQEDPRIRASIYATARLAFDAWTEPVYEEVARAAEKLDASEVDSLIAQAAVDEVESGRRLADEATAQRFRAIQLLLAHQPLHLHVEMETHLLRHTRLRGAASEHQPHTGARSIKPFHRIRPFNSCAGRPRGRPRTVASSPIPAPAPCGRPQSAGNSARADCSR